MLSEHRDALRELWEHDTDIEKPVLDDQQLERLDAIIKEAIRDQFSVRIMYYEDSKINQLEGKILVKGNNLYLDGKKLK